MYCLVRFEADIAFVVGAAMAQWVAEKHGVTSVNAHTLVRKIVPCTSKVTAIDLMHLTKSLQMLLLLDCGAHAHELHELQEVMAERPGRRKMRQEMRSSGTGTCRSSR